MGVEVNDKDSFDAKVVDGILGGDCNVVAQTKAVELGCHSVVARRANYGNPVG